MQEYMATTDTVAGVFASTDTDFYIVQDDIAQHW